MLPSFSIPTSRLSSFGVLELAYIGDAVYELLVRTKLCQNPALTKNLHKRAVAVVKAQAQAEAAERILPLLTEEERGVYTRGRNANPHTLPRAATRAAYMAATGLEAVFGWLYLSGQEERVRKLFEVCMGENHI